MTPEQRYRFEQAKDKSPATGSFLLWIPLFLFVAWLTQSPPVKEAFAPLEEVVNVHQYDVASVPKYRNNDPVCGGDTWCFLGWRI